MNNDRLAQIPVPLQLQLDECKAMLGKAVQEADALRKARDRLKAELGDYKEAYQEIQANVRSARKERDNYLKDLVAMQEELAKLERRINPVPGGWQVHDEVDDAPPRRGRVLLQAPGVPMPPMPPVHRDAYVDPQAVVDNLRNPFVPPPAPVVEDVPDFVIDAARDAVKLAEYDATRAYQKAMEPGAGKDRLQAYLAANRHFAEMQQQYTQLKNQKARLEAQARAAPQRLDEDDDL